MISMSMSVFEHLIELFFFMADHDVSDKSAVGRNEYV